MKLIVYLTEIQIKKLNRENENSFANNNFTFTYGKQNGLN